MKKIFKKFKGIFCFTICLCIAVATFQVGVFAEESGVIVNSKLLQNNDGTVYGNGILSGLGDNGTPELNHIQQVLLFQFSFLKRYCTLEQLLQ